MLKRLTNRAKAHLEQVQLLELQHELGVLALGWRLIQQPHKGLEQLHHLGPQPWRVSRIRSRRQHGPEKLSTAKSKVDTATILSQAVQCCCFQQT